MSTTSTLSQQLADCKTHLAAASKALASIKATAEAVNLAEGETALPSSRPITLEQAMVVVRWLHAGSRDVTEEFEKHCPLQGTARWEKSGSLSQLCEDSMVYHAIDFPTIIRLVHKHLCDTYAPYLLKAVSLSGGNPDGAAHMRQEYSELMGHRPPYTGRGAF